MELSKITKSFTESVIREMTRISRKHDGCINLAQGFPDFSAPVKIKKAAINAIQQDINQYAITWGSKSLRNAISEKVTNYNNIKVDPLKNITVTCGSTEAMISSLKAIINPGDEVIIFEPFYENYGPDCKLSGATPKYVTLQPPEWKFDPEEIKRKFNAKTKAIIINTPNNPTGKVFSREELELIADLCQDYDAIAITDEIYEHILYDGKNHISIASLEGMEERSITINSISKTYSLTGWRVGWAIASEKITNEIKKVHDFLTVGAPAPLQEGAAFALGMKQKYYINLKNFYTKARDTLIEILKETSLKPFYPKGSYYIMTDCTQYMDERGLNNSTELAIDIIKNVGVATVPGGSFFESEEKGKHLTRFCFCKKEETLQAAKKRLEKLRK